MTEYDDAYDEEYYNSARNLANESLAEMSIREQLQNMSLSFEKMAIYLSRLVEYASSDDPLALERMKKTYERDVLGLKERMEVLKRSTFNYIARLRTTLPYSTAYANLAVLYVRAAQHIEGASYRLFIYRTKYGWTDNEIGTDIANLTQKLVEASSGMVRLFRNIGVNRRLAEDAISQVYRAEEEIDAIYRRLYVRILARIGSDVARMALLLAIADSMEGVADSLKDLCDYSLILH